MILPEGII